MTRARTSEPLVVLVSAAVTITMVLLVLWQWLAVNTVRDPEPVLGASAPMAQPATPVWSVRRAPEVLSWRLNSTALAASLTPLTDRLGETSCLSVTIDGRAVVDEAADSAAIPGSTQKLLTAAVALDLLGPQYRFTTRVVGELGPDGVVRGDLVIIGGGDPLLSTADWPTSGVQRHPPFNITPLEQLVDAVVAAGVVRVEGRVVGDGSRYDDEWFHPSWSTALHGAEAGPVDALVVDDTREDPTRDPAQFAAAVVTDLLDERGVSIAGAPTAAASGAVDAAASTPIAAIDSAPLADVVAQMLTTSDNTTAEMLLKELGVQVAGQGSWTAGAAIIADTVRAWTAPAAHAGMVVADGSGLSRDNRISCSLLVALLHREGPTGDLGVGLPVAATSGTLMDEFTETDVAGRLLAKTGTLGGVKALAGFLLPSIDAPPGAQTVEFALLLNEPGVDDGPYRAIWSDQLAPGLASYPNAPTAAELQPLGAAGR